MLDEFKKFLMKGNMIDMAVGIIIGAAFGTVVKSLVADVIMPPIGMLLGGIDFSGLFIALNGESYSTLAAAQAAGAPTINYGMFINNCVTLLIVGFAVFLLVKAVNNLKDKEEPAPEAPKTPEEILLLREIRDALAKP
ncbi:large conductance mechanosensitive channel protein MscL [Litorivivens sp.]|uniref:large conductance mechanosensitive channel protein MscL n=1 Tax=Litorivivens sp. TaxID=2020868 RepID=UPI00356751EA